MARRRDDAVLAVRTTFAAWVRNRLRGLGLSEADLVQIAPVAAGWLERLDNPRPSDDIGFLEARDVILALGGDPGEVFHELALILAREDAARRRL
jgi:hypothetical protein